jgi:hypothetical protein
MNWLATRVDRTLQHLFDVCRKLRECLLCGEQIEIPQLVRLGEGIVEVFKKGRPISAPQV